jgi:LysR family transcriptional regulator, putative pyruvate carboxylase regulator
MTLDLRDLDVFLAVEREGSFGRAANALMVTQPAVSERIRHLEHAVGRPLFDRTTRGVTITAAGAALVPYAHRCLTVAAESIEAARRADGTRSLVVAVHSTFAQRVVPLVLDALEPARRRLAIRDVHSEDVAGLVLDGVADIGFALSASAPRGLRRVELPADDIVCAVDTDHPLASKRRVSLKHLRETLLAVNAWGDGAQGFMDQLGVAGIEDWRIRYCGDAATALALACNNGHVALVARSAFAMSARETLREIPLPGLSRWRVRLDLLHRRADRDEPLVRNLKTLAERVPTKAAP